MAATLAYDTLLFDLDGTLTASGPGIVDCVRHALAAVGHQGLAQERLRDFIGPPLIVSFQRIAGLDEAAARRAISAYRARYVKSGMFNNSVYPGIPQLLRALVDSGHTLAVATSKATPHAQQILEHFALAEYFQVVVGANLDGTRVAKSDVVAATLLALGVDGRRSAAVLVGDRDVDIIGATANGIDSIGVLWGYGSRAELEEAGATHVVTTVAELGRLLA